VLTEDFLFSSADLGVVEAITERATGEKRSLADVPEYQTAVKAMTNDPDTLLRQAYFVHPLQINPYGLTSGLIFGMLENTAMEEMAEEIEEARAAIVEMYGELPAYRLVAYADYADADYQYASVILVYEDAADAQTAVELIPQRVEIAQSTVTRRPLKTMLEERESELTPTLIEDEATGLSAAVFVWRYPHPPTERGEMGLMPVPGLTFRMFQQQIFARDTLWLAYNIE
jgi:hypothetical protein